MVECDSGVILKVDVPDVMQWAKPVASLAAKNAEWPHRQAGPWIATASSRSRYGTAGVGRLPMINRRRRDEDQFDQRSSSAVRACAAP